ncbi:MAG: PAS domain S-box protein [Balneolaceae bacterium]
MNLNELIDKHAKDEKSAEALKQAFLELNEAKERAEQHLDLLERAIRSDYDSILITELSIEKPGPKIVYVNDGFTKMTGYTREEAIGQTPRMLQGEKTDRAVLDKLKKRLKEGQAFFGHTVNYRKDGTEFINQWDIHPLTNADGEITHWVSYQHDITERKRSEQKLVDIQVEFDKLQEESKKTLIDVDEQGNVVTSNKAFRDLVGYNDEELKQFKVWEILDEEYIESFRHKFDSFKPSDFDGQAYKLELKNKHGKTLEVEAKSRLLSSNGQKIVRISFQNKSLQKRIMSVLSNRNKNFDAVFGQKAEFSYKLVKNPDGNFQFNYLSENFAEITGLTSNEASGMRLEEFIHEKDISLFKSHIQTVFEGRPNTEQFRIRNKEGGYTEVIDYAKPDWDADRSTVVAVKGATSTEISSEMKSEK